MLADMNGNSWRYNNSTRNLAILHESSIRRSKILDPKRARFKSDPRVLQRYRGEIEAHSAHARPPDYERLIRREGDQSARRFGDHHSGIIRHLIAKRPPEYADAGSIYRFVLSEYQIKIKGSDDNRTGPNVNLRAPMVRSSQEERCYVILQQNRGNFELSSELTRYSQAEASSRHLAYHDMSPLISAYDNVGASDKDCLSRACVTFKCNVDDEHVLGFLIYHVTERELLLSRTTPIAGSRPRLPFTKFLSAQLDEFSRG
jgi:hypothetical protein